MRFSSIVFIRTLPFPPAIVRHGLSPNSETPCCWPCLVFDQAMSTVLLVILWQSAYTNSAKGASAHMSSMIE